MNHDLTIGKPSSTLFKFTFPMFVSVIFQQMYNIADSAIAGKFAGENALAAIGASYPITMIFMAVATGSNVGCTVVLSQFFGAKKLKNFKTAASTAIIYGTVISLTLTLIAVLCSPLMLEAINTPDSIFSDAETYLNIYLFGFVFLFLYNMINGIFNAMGDSRTPLYLLIASSLMNIVLDYILVAVFPYGVAGAAVATLIAQGAACISAFVLMIFRLRKITVEEKPPRFSLHMLTTILFIAVPSILQSSFVSVGNLFIQSLINSCGESVIAGFSAATKLNTFAVTSMTTIGSGVSSFTAQNIGAGEIKRVKSGLRSGLILALCFTLPFMIAYYFFGEPFLMLFMEDGGSAALAAGMEFLRIVSPFFPFVCCKLIFDAVLRGSKAILLFMITTFSDLIIRVAVSFIFFDSLQQLSVYYSWPIGWIIGALLSFVFYFSGLWHKRRLS